MYIEMFDGNPLQFPYFKSMFGDSVEKKIEDLQERLTCLIKLATGEARKLVKPFMINMSLVSRMLLNC